VLQDSTRFVSLDPFRHLQTTAVAATAEAVVSYDGDNNDYVIDVMIMN
jgi:hypothetical protein